VVEPNLKWRGIYQELHGVYKDLYPALKGSFDRLTAFA